MNRAVDDKGKRLFEGDYVFAEEAVEYENGAYSDEVLIVISIARGIIKLAVPSLEAKTKKDRLALIEKDWFIRSCTWEYENNGLEKLEQSQPEVDKEEKK